MGNQGLPRAHWGSRLGFILAAAGSAIGLGNIWKFPYIAGANGGGLFVLIYLVCIALVGIPIMMAEIMIGRAAQKQPVAAFHALQGERTRWAAVGWMGVVAGFVILSYYMVVAGWTMDYTLKSIANFTRPIHDEALERSTEYLAVTPLDEMREGLARDRARRLGAREATLIRAQVPRSVWSAYGRYAMALERAEDAESAREVLMQDPDLARLVSQALPVQHELDEAAARAQQEAAAHYGALSAAEVLQEAGTLNRRQHIFRQVEAAFVALATDGWTCTFWAALFMLVCISIVAGGIASGIERTCRVLMPMLLVLILIMVVYGAFLPGFGEAVSFVFKPDIHKLKPSGVLEALGHAFFTLSLGMGAMITYGSYQTSKRALGSESMAIALLDTGVALLACLMIFPIVFSYGQEASAGPGLVFVSMPLAFAEIGKGGMILSVVFFGLVSLAALTSAISLLEVVVSYFIDEREWSRARAAWSLGGVIFLFGIPSAFAMDKRFLMTGWEPGYGMNFFDTMDYLASNWLLPMGGLLISLYVGWVMPKRFRDAELDGIAPWLVRIWLVLVRYVAPMLVVLVLLQKAGFLDADEFLFTLLH